MGMSVEMFIKTRPKYFTTYDTLIMFPDKQRCTVWLLSLCLFLLKIITVNLPTEKQNPAKVAHFVILSMAMLREHYVCQSVPVVQKIKE